MEAHGTDSVSQPACCRKIILRVIIFFEKLTAMVYDIMLLNVPSTEKS